jgi:hypothetical protein
MPRNTKPLIEIDLKKHPQAIVTPQQESSFTIGDLHANVLKAIHFLISFGAIGALEDNAYSRLVSLVNYFESNPSSIQEEHILSFKRFLMNHIKVIHTNCLYRFIGDTLADRRHNDYLMLLLFDHLKYLGLRYEIILSNHDSWFIGYIGGSKKEFADPQQVQSLVNLHDLLRRKVVKLPDVKTLYKSAIYPHLRLFALEIDKASGQNHFYSHAPVLFSWVLHIAKELFIKNIPEALDKCDLTTFNRLVQEINEKVRMKLQVSSFYDAIKLPREKKDSDSWNKERYSYLGLALWARSQGDGTEVAQCLAQNQGLGDAEDQFATKLNLLRIHGHDGPLPGKKKSRTLPHAVCLDTLLGKGLNYDRASTESGGGVPRVYVSPSREESPQSQHYAVLSHPGRRVVIPRNDPEAALQSPSSTTSPSQSTAFTWGMSALVLGLLGGGSLLACGILFATAATTAAAFITATGVGAAVFLAGAALIGTIILIQSIAKRSGEQGKNSTVSKSSIFSCINNLFDILGPQKIDFGA